MFKEHVMYICLFMVHRVQASVASTLIFLNKLPMKLNPVIRPIMDSIKKEEQTIMQVCRIKLQVYLSWDAV